MPLEAGEAERQDETAEEELDLLGGDSEATDDVTTPEPPCRPRALLPVVHRLEPSRPPGEGQLHVPSAGATIGQAPPRPRRPAKTARDSGRSGDAPGASVGCRSFCPPVPNRPVEQEVPGQRRTARCAVRPSCSGAGDCRRHGSRRVRDPSRCSWSTTANRRRDENRDEGFIFQAALRSARTVRSIPRPNLRGTRDRRLGRCVADLQYRDVYEFAVGHGIATLAVVGDGTCRTVHTRWIPGADVERVAPATIEGVESGDGGAGWAHRRRPAAQKCFEPSSFSTANGSRTNGEVPRPGPSARRRRGAAPAGRVAAQRIEEGIAPLADPHVLDAFRIANRVMARRGRRRRGPMQGKDARQVDPPTWRPFQLAFLLMNLHGIAEPASRTTARSWTCCSSRPAAARPKPTWDWQLSRWSIAGCGTRGSRRPGLSVLMRYTLRLLTLDQLSRARDADLRPGARAAKDVREARRLAVRDRPVGRQGGHAESDGRQGGDNDPAALAQRSPSRTTTASRRRSPWRIARGAARSSSRSSFQLMPNPTSRPTSALPA